jgi:hypothetical protein
LNHRIIVGTLGLSILALMLLIPSAAYATDIQPCQINSWSPNYPNQVSPGQTIQVTSTINVACGQWRTFYTARVDLVNRATGQLYSTSEFQIGWQPDMNATITNPATAPQTAGEWKLQFNLYIFEEGSQDGNPFHNTFNVNVGGTNTATTAQQNVTTVAPAAVQQQLVSNTTSVNSAMPQAPPVASSVDSSSRLSVDAPFISIVLACVALVGLALVATRREHK